MYNTIHWTIQSNHDWIITNCIYQAKRVLGKATISRCRQLLLWAWQSKIRKMVQKHCECTLIIEYLLHTISENMVGKYRRGGGGGGPKVTLQCWVLHQFHIVTCNFADAMLLSVQLSFELSRILSPKFENFRHSDNIISNHLYRSFQACLNAPIFQITVDNYLLHLIWKMRQNGFEMTKLSSILCISFYNIDYVTRHLNWAALKFSFFFQDKRYSNSQS